MADESLSDLLRRYRSRAGLTQAALAAKAGLSDQAISVLERGTRRRPRIDTVRALISVLRLDKAEAEQFLAVARGKNVPAGPETAPVERMPLPWQLPPSVPDFTGRAAQIEAILDVLRNPLSVGHTVGLVAVTGMGGIGKTTLAIHAAHSLAETYPDGHLYLNLRGYGPGKPISTADALRQLLRSLGLDLQLIPDDVEAASGLLRSQLAGRRVLLLLDNAADAAHVLPLLPGSAGSAAIITSRESLAGLPGARQIRLDALSQSESVELLSGVVGHDRIAAEPAAAAALASFTGRLPLAVRLIGGRLAARPSWPIHHLVELLEDEERRLDTLGSDDSGVRANIASSVDFLRTSDRALDREAAAALPLLSIPDGPDLLLVVAAHLLDRPIRRAGEILERLVDLNLLESVAPDHYRFHDLIRVYARELAEQDVAESVRNASQENVLRFYVGAAWQCHALTHPRSPRLEFATVKIEQLSALATRESALQWFSDEYRSISDRLAQATTSSLARSPLLPELVLAMFGYHEPRQAWFEMRELSRGLAELATSVGRLGVAAWLFHDRAIPEVENGDLAAAVQPLERALTMFRELADLPGQARCASSLTFVLSNLGRIDEALGYGYQSLDISQEIGDRTLEGVAYTALGLLYERAGDYATADDGFDRGIALARELGDLRSELKRQTNAAFSHLLAGRHEAALARTLSAHEAASRFGDDVSRMEASGMLAVIYASMNDFTAAEKYAQQALELTRQTKNSIRQGRFYLELARIQAAAGNRSAAINSATEAVAVLTGISPLHGSNAEELLDSLRRGEPYAYEVSPHSF
ncbi:tetratricopeptide repeat protein [Kribbella sandramycini]|uniref:Tetratricopeptide (TPR) repeat protein n=1 Tax=Kribbella sandramycini TaxID=60450 RepID=A0A7Y4L390_9ACTN|nr:tetratricopeptide repeat protein [Kribbella sandramycini]MBB6571092.1 tetratricopeptide (TPR) repeat protein [Kribbella sandramycini]NOL43499.1 tetratricopeptide repeat protein [Kribbella sandramycini]